MRGERGEGGGGRVGEGISIYVQWKHFDLATLGVEESVPISEVS